MNEEVFKEAIKNEGWIIRRKGGYIYFKRRDLSKPYNQGNIYSCHTKDMQEAIATIREWILHGFPKTRKEKEADLLFVDYLYSFWSDESLYFKSAEYEGRHITRYYVQHCRGFVRAYAEDFFKGKRISEINEDFLNKFFDTIFTHVSKRTGRLLSKGSIVKIKEVVLLPLKWGRRKGIVKQIIDFSIICPRISFKPIASKGILTDEETNILLAHKWTSRKAYISFCIAVNCGLRKGEIRALKIGNIKNGFIVVAHSYNDTEGLKCTKTGKMRVVPCPDDLLALIADYVFSLPENERGEDCYLLTSDMRQGAPIERDYITKRFYKAMRDCGIERVKINTLTGEKEVISFHSLRHQTATRWIKSGLDMRLIAKAMGHSVKMLEHYSDHLGLNDTAKLRSGLVAAGVLGAIVKALPAPSD